MKYLIKTVFIKVSFSSTEIKKKLHLRFQACHHRLLKHILHFMSILSMLFLCSGIAELFCRLNKPVMMYLRVNVQCANCFDLSRNKSDWHFIFIFAGHNRPPPYIVNLCPVSSIRRRYYFHKQSAYCACASRELLWFISRFINISRNVIFFLFSAQCGRAGAIYLLLFQSDNVPLSSALYPLTFSQYPRKYSCIHRSKSFDSQIQQRIN